MRSSKWTRAAFAGVLAVPLFAVVAAVPAAAQAPGSYDATPLSAQERVDGPKAPTSRLAKTDRSLLGRTDTAPVSVMIKFDYDSIATYAGGVRGLAPTSPSVTGRALSRSAGEQRYESYLAGREAAVVGGLQRRVPGLTVHQRLRVVYGGVSATVPANRIGDLLTVTGVVAVQRDELHAPLTDSSPGFIGATTVYPQLGGDRNAGKGVIFGVLDTGAWPEHPSFADQGHLPAPPPKADGTPRACNFGDNPLTPAADPFACTNKLIGGAPFLATYLSNPDRAAREPFHTARDSNGHGTHTGSTSAGNVLASAQVLGVERGPVNGIAPGAYVSVYKVCGIDGCFDSDSAAAVQQAILDGVKVINFSISGGTNPFGDPVELAFLDAYAAGVFVAASAGNSGPGAATVNHVSPWVTTVAASTQRREYVSTLTLSAGGDTLTLTGASITAGAGPAPVVLSSAAPYSNVNCSAPAPAGTFTGKIVACQRGGGIARVDKGYNVFQGGAIGMILYNPVLQDVETDNHWLPTVHLADDTEFLGFMGSHTGVTASFTAGQKVNGQGDVMAAFSSRGPGGLGIKPDITAPGVQVLAGHTPVRESPTGGPPGEYFQAIAGTSMSSPHIAGSALLLRALHPTWTPGQVKSA
ncbi:MAG TPA: S8 family serine peptidase, partial [Micromonosporaceae bacterium]|nr:S8 family serine peptidase [Micromonosporaceae bacterium]